MIQGFHTLMLVKLFLKIQFTKDIFFCKTKASLDVFSFIYNYSFLHNKFMTQIIRCQMCFLVLYLTYLVIIRIILGIHVD